MILRKSLLPLYILSRLLCIHSFSRNPLKVSFWGSVLSTMGAIGYAVFHLTLAKISVNPVADVIKPPNILALIIDSYNRYSGLSCFTVIVITTILMQGKMVEAIRTLEAVDDIFESKLGIVVDNFRWGRNVAIQLFGLLTLLAILECYNCLMYIQDTITFTDYCLVMCIVPLFVIGTTEVQFIAYLQLIRNRLIHLNEILRRYSNAITCTTDQLTRGGNQIDRNTSSINKINSEILTTMWSPNQSDNISLEIAPRVEKISEKKKKGFELLRKIRERKKVHHILVEKIYFKNLHFIESLIKAEDIYMKLEKVSELISLCFGLPITVILAIKFTTLTSLLYFCCMILIKITSGHDLDNDDKDQLLSSSGWIAMHILEVFIVSYISSLTTNESRKVGSNLHKFGLRVDDVNIKQKIKLFSVHLLNNRIQFVPLGLFHLDLSFMYALIGAVSTYLIILIQFDIAQKEMMKPNTSAVANHSIIAATR